LSSCSHALLHAANKKEDEKKNKQRIARGLQLEW
jgi:hypothetical protein